MANTEKIVEELSGLTVLEAAELVKELEEKWGVSAAAPVAVAAAATVYFLIAVRDMGCLFSTILKIHK